MLAGASAFRTRGMWVILPIRAARQKRRQTMMIDTSGNRLRPSTRDRDLWSTLRSGKRALRRIVGRRALRRGRAIGWRAHAFTVGGRDRQLIVPRSVAPDSRRAHADVRFAAVVPVVHPEHRNVKDYSVVDAHLKVAATSIANQDEPTMTVVIGHRPPAWLAEYRETMVFVDIAESVEMRGQLPTPVDKGIKMLIGTHLAQRIANAGVILTADADDLLAADITARVGDHLSANPDSNGVCWTYGYVLMMKPDGDGSVYIGPVYEIRHFNRYCGTCRAITWSRVQQAMRHSLNHFAHTFALLERELDMLENGLLTPSTEAISALDRAVRTMPDSVREEIDHLGRHITDYFGLDEVTFRGAAKSCRHGQHDGPRGGDVNWEAVVGRVKTKLAIATLGLGSVNRR